MKNSNNSWRRNITSHHCVAKSENGTNHPDNLIRLRAGKHEALHTLFGNDLPNEQILKILNLNQNAFTQDFKDAIQNMVNEMRGGIYKENIFRDCRKL